MGSYHIAQICLNGHATTPSADTNPSLMKKFCTKCGTETITNCPYCNESIHGKYDSGAVVLGAKYHVPSYCHNCGKPYPWTSSALDAAKELLFLENLSQEEIDYFNENISAIAVDTPKTTVVSTKLKIILSNASSIVTSSLHDIIVDIGSETAKKIILGE